MPLYEFKCSQCSEREERQLKFADFDVPQACVKCGAPLERLISRTSPPLFKVPGFYSTDYRKKKPGSF